MEHLPIFVGLSGRSVLLVGGGEAAARRLRLLARTPARIIVTAAEPGAEIAATAAQGRIVLLSRPFRAEDVAGCALVFVAEEDEGAAAEVAAAARAAGVPVNAADRPELSSFLMPAIVDRDPIVIAIGSGGAAPLLAREVRARIESLLPARLGELARFAGRLRHRVAEALADAAARRRFWERVLAGPLGEAVLAGRAAEAEALFEAALASPLHACSGHVALVGCGPGDPDLLTFRALRVMQAADLVVHEAALAPRLLDSVRRDAERRALVPASEGTHFAAEDLALIAAHVRAGRRVALLMAGDGREAEARAQGLRKAGLHVEIVPGVARIQACPFGPGGP